ncbi:translation elongation factor 2 (EF-2/EF-G) [Desulfonatronum thiosulfatophilum]|uniref:Elongation factor G n=1 Tax=Desulfonatronum thiosulfatophilum TaxID=617002 RepID=A0A1G6EQV7_9BACT|nr:elongation factor G [Desulfonatronum thiosulfatophilum]SDB59770.1 translation elongation factor 2 (EF-2/EF-G) [Desulfonatronum thiosulfatophilum]
MQDRLSTQRTYALVGHGGCGKTSVAEMLLFNAGVINRLGKIDEGTACLDYEPEEIKRRGSIQPGFGHFQWKKNPHFLIDTPGDNNFCGDLPYLLTAADGAVFVIDAVDGVKPLTKRFWAEVKTAGLPAMVIINKMDRDRANFEMAFAGLQEILGIKPVLLHLPLGTESDFRGVVDILAGKALFFDDAGNLKPGEIPAEVADQAESLRETMMENIAESDENLMEKYLEEGSLSLEEMLPALRKGVLNGELVPVTVCAALVNRGGGLLLDVVQDLMPSPLDRTAPWLDSEGNERPSSHDAPTACFVFKTIADPFTGQLSVLRVLSGTVSPDMTLLNPAKDGKERLGQILLPQGKTTVPCKDTLGPGAIIAVAKLKNTATADTLCDEKKPFQLEAPKLPTSMITYALGAAEKGEEDKVYAAVQKLLDEDVTLNLTRGEETGEMLLSGMGQMHIETAVEKVRRRYKVNVVLKPPKVPYRETIKGRAEVQGRYKKQTGGRGQFGDCWIRMEPLPRGQGYEFVDAIVGGSIPRQYIPAVDKGIQESSQRGVLAGYPLVDFKVTLFDGSFHTVDSSEMAFKVAGSMAFKKAAEDSKIVLLEPIVLMTVYTPDEFMGDIIGDLSSRRGKVLGTDSHAGVTEIRAHLPMSEVLEYAPTLRSMTGGQGTFVMEFDHYEECPPPVAEKVVAEAKAQED